MPGSRAPLPGPRYDFLRIPSCCRLGIFSSIFYISYESLIDGVVSLEFTEGDAQNEWHESLPWPGKPMKNRMPVLLEVEMPFPQVTTRPLQSFRSVMISPFI